ncbi:MAG: zinc ribbon domain-containing protein [Prevotella sp.]|nr:zinc ribbon domain-containing protein [Prevotella sp.]MBR4651143.1 zinc ribbon domain-containing protein [Prevotella sp.]
MEEKKRCPYCGEEILAVAKKCKHCGKWLNIVEPEAKKETKPCPVCGEQIEENAEVCPHCHERTNFNKENHSVKENIDLNNNNFNNNIGEYYCKTCGERLDSVNKCSKCGDEDPLYLDIVTSSKSIFKFIASVVALVLSLLIMWFAIELGVASVSWKSFVCYLILCYILNSIMGRIRILITWQMLDEYERTIRNVLRKNGRLSAIDDWKDLINDNLK